MNKTTTIYPNFSEFQIMCRGPQIMLSRAGGLLVWDPWFRPIASIHS